MDRYSSGSYRLFTIVNLLFLTGVAALCILPLLHILAVSFSSKGPASANLVGIWPVGFNVSAYESVLANKEFLNAFFISLKRVVLGVGVNMALSVLMAYPLSKESNVFRFRNFFAWLIVFTMLFNGGLIPNYVLVNQLGLANSIWALILPSAVSAFGIVLLLNFFRQLPKELEESAFLDGASYFRVLVSLFIPLSLPAIATLTLFAAVYHWNSWFDGLIYMNKASLYPLQTYLQILLGKTTQAISLDDAARTAIVSQRSLVAAQIYIAMLPILLVYPFVQKYFQTGIVLGSVKG